MGLDFESMDWRVPLRKALRTLPWYTLAPTFLVGASLGLLFMLLGLFPKISNGYWEFVVATFSTGLFLWFIRQLIRILWFVRSTVAERNQYPRAGWR